MPWTDPTLWLPIGGLGLACLLFAERRAIRGGIVVGKLVASTAFVAIALHAGIGGAFTTPEGPLFLAGMLLCWLGDALLLPPGKTLWFRLGIGAFLLAHVAYAAGCWAAGVDLTALGVSSAALALGAAAVLRWLAPHVPGEFATAVRCYVVVIGLMVASAFASVAAGITSLVGLGALLFALSDLSVARERFVSPAFSNSLWGLPMYYVAQVLLAFSMQSFSAD